MQILYHALWAKQRIQVKTVILLLFCLFLNSVGIARAESPSIEPALFYFSVNKTSYFDPNFLYVDIILSASTTEYNLLDFNINFDSSAIALISASSSTNCPLILNEDIDNENNNYTLTCANPSPLSEKSTITHFVFQKLTEGFTKLSFNHASAFLANGSGEMTEALSESHNVFLVK